LTQFKNHKATESPNLLVGLNNPDDGGVIQVGDQKIIQTVDFFTPILDNPYDWGRVAAANALSDVYAMGGEPISALQLVCWPRSEISFDILSEVIKGGLDTMQKANCTVIGGHSIDDKEPKYGFSITGVIKDKIFKNNEIKDGDRLFLTKPIGTGIITTAIKRGVASDESVNIVTDIMTELNKKSLNFSLDNNANAITDITGFGLLGHLYEMLNDSKLSATIKFDSVPLIENIYDYLDKEIFPSGSLRNYEYLSDKLISDLDEQSLKILCDAQTNGGFLISIPKNQNIKLQKDMELNKNIWEIGEINSKYNEKINII
tara:strand:- start:138 stop:1088 length:951 start_codon:yes stop_codon:yes gene_type:complete